MIRKWFFILKLIKLILTRKDLHLVLFWKWEFLEGESILFKKSVHQSTSVGTENWLLSYFFRGVSRLRAVSSRICCSVHPLQGKPNGTGECEAERPKPGTHPVRSWGLSHGMLSSWPALFLTSLVLAFVVGGIYRAWLLQSTSAFVVFVEVVKPREEWRKLSQIDSSRLAQLCYQKHQPSSISPAA